MSLTDKLRELSSLDKSVDVPSLIREAERLEAQNARLRELVRSAYAEGYSDAALDEDGNSEDAMWTKSFTAKELDALDKEANDGSADA